MADASGAAPTATAAVREFPGDDIALLNRLRIQPEISWPAVIIFFAAFGVIFGMTALALNGLAPFWVGALVNGVAAYVLSTPFHEASHSMVARNRAVNDTFGRLSLFYISPFIPYTLFRFIHFIHHRDANGETDVADRFVAEGPKFLRPVRWWFLDVSYAIVYFSKYFARRPLSEKLDVLTAVAATVVVWGGLIAAGYGFETLMLWIIPTRIALFLMTLTLAVMPHHPHEVGHRVDPYRATSIREGAEWFWTPVLMGQNYHLAHHLYPTVPFYRLKRAWNARLAFHLSHDPAIVQAFEFRPAPAKANT